MAIKLRLQLQSFFTFSSVLLAAAFVGSVTAQWDPHFTENRTSIVHLFEWRWNDIAEECERFLGPYGFGGVQTSPPNENVVQTSGGNMRPWWERYQPVSYKLVTRSGTEEEFKSMVLRCNAVGVRIYIDAVINHMTGHGATGVGTAGSNFDSIALNYPEYSEYDFNGGPYGKLCTTESGNIEDTSYGNDAEQVRNCRLSSLNDLNQGSDYVRKTIIGYFNRLISFGVAGFRVDASKHMWPGDLQAIYDKVNALSVEHGFPSGARPFIYQEVIDNGGEAIAASDYDGLGRITEFKGCANIGNVFRGWNGPTGQPQQLNYLKNWGAGWGLMPDGSALAFVDNHDNQRGHGSGGASILTFRISKLYKMAQAFTLAWPYGITRIMSSYYWEQDLANPDDPGSDRNNWMGPPHDSEYNTLPVTLLPDFTCGNGWICEHRWRQIYNMVRFRNVVKGTGVTWRWDNQKDQIAFSRGNRGFVAFNNDNYPLDAAIQTGLPSGSYCDVISGNLVNGKCTGRVIEVGSDGVTSLYISNEIVGDQDPFVAIHADAKQ